MSNICFPPHQVWFLTILHFICLAGGLMDVLVALGLDWYGMRLRLCVCSFTSLNAPLLTIFKTRVELVQFVLSFYTVLIFLDVNFPLCIYRNLIQVMRFFIDKNLIFFSMVVVATVDTLKCSYTLVFTFATKKILKANKNGYQLLYTRYSM